MIKNALIIFLTSLIVNLASAQNEFVSVRGNEILNSTGEKLLLKGINLGNWLVPEGYMFKFEYAASPRLIYEVFDQMIGPDEAKKFWKKLAQKYANEKIIIGYDLLNEPIAHYFDQEKLNPLLEPLYQKIVSAIREVDQNHLIFLGGAQWDSNFQVFGPPFDSKLVYTFHKYWTDTDESVIKEYMDFRDKHNVPIWMGESGENTKEWITEFRKTLERNEIGWCFWPYKKLDAESCPVSITKTKEYDTIINFADGERAGFENLRENHPDIELVRKALNDYLENCKFRNCRINTEYLKALGLNK